MKLKLFDDSGITVFKTKGKKDKIKEELEEFFEYKF
jgi:hypothetical protein